jgi:uncharacterized protein with HEPN domain
MDDPSLKELVWKVVEQDIPTLKKQIEKILAQL